MGLGLYSQVWRKWWHICYFRSHLLSLLVDVSLWIRVLQLCVHLSDL